MEHICYHSIYEVLHSIQLFPVDASDSKKDVLQPTSLIVETKAAHISATGQEPITRSLQLPHIPVMAFSQNDLFLV